MTELKSNFLTFEFFQQPNPVHFEIASLMTRFFTQLSKNYIKSTNNQVINAKSRHLWAATMQKLQQEEKLIVRKENISVREKIYHSVSKMNLSYECHKVSLKSRDRKLE